MTDKIPLIALLGLGKAPLSHSYLSQTYVAASAKLDDACAWLQSLGIDYSRTRVGRYKALFAALARHQSANTLDAFSKEYTFSSLVNAAHEVAELVRIYEGLSIHRDASFVARLHEALKGHELYVLDNNDRSGRDFSLELSIAAKFARTGLSIDFDHDADLKTEIYGVPFYVECKRIKSANKVQRRIKNGLNQLHTRYAKSDNPAHARGILVVSIGKTINSDLGLLEAENPQSLGEKAFRHNRAFIEMYKRYWQKKVDHRTLGVAVILDTPGISTLNKQLVTCHEITVNNSVPINTPDYAFLLQVANQVFPRPT